MRDYMDRWITSPSWGPPPPCKQALRICQALMQARVSAKNDIINFGMRQRNQGARLFKAELR